ncbi:protein SGT1 homolog isoform X2 [Phoenix dactylifera]|uniref:Protein SGT1 homolog n=1 Tax=Phoenix dactylifera TaxID=42345 RepID=A0A8B7CDI2_PHODC|nr:protein SGT1 homolog isoform X2 [Phoenix dactylifera]
MATDLEARAKEAFVDDNFELAVDLYTQALDMDPKNADLYADRAQANIKLKNFTEAVADANKAIELDPLIVKAYLRKGTACVKLEEYQTAKASLETGACLAPGDSRFTRLIKECNERIAEETIDLPKKVMLNVPPSTMSSSSNISTEIAKDSQPLKDATCQSTAMPNKPKYRHDYYNSSTEVVLTIFAKGIPAKNVSVDFGEQTLSVIIDIPGEEKYHFQPRLFEKIIPKNCRYEVMSSKIEIRLSKAEPITWTSLEFSDKRTVPQKINTSSAPGCQRPSKAKIDWDKLEAQVKKEEKEEKLDGDAALNKLFQDIYRDADEDTRRAMSKSFIESNGTVLSTNWKEVGSKRVGGSPPAGMELKKWEY